MQNVGNTFCYYHMAYVSSTQFVSQQLVTCRRNSNTLTIHNDSLSWVEATSPCIWWFQQMQLF